MTRLALLIATLALAAAGCSGHKNAEPQQPSAPEPTSATGSTANGSASGTRQLTDLRSVGQLRSLFNTRSGEPRLIVLVSPT